MVNQHGGQRRHFRDRADAGRQLGVALERYGGKDVVVLALPRGGVPVAAEVARHLGAPLDLLIARKIGHPAQPELAMGAVVDGPTPTVVRNDGVIRATGVSSEAFDRILAQELAEARRRLERYLQGRPPIALEGRTVIVVDDGIATGATMRAALRALKSRHSRRTVLAVPVASADALATLRPDADDIVCLQVADGLGAVGLYYDDFDQVSDEEVIATLAEFAPPDTAPGSAKAQ